MDVASESKNIVPLKQSQRSQLCRRCKNIQLKIAHMMDDVQPSLEANTNVEVIRWIADLGSLEECLNQSSCLLCKIFIECRPRSEPSESLKHLVRELPIQFEKPTYFFAFSLGRVWLPQDVKLRIMTTPTKQEGVQWAASGPVPDPHPELGNYSADGGAFCLCSPNDDDEVRVRKVSKSADLALLRCWLSECQAHHSCDPTYSLSIVQSVVPISVIDCTSRTLVSYTIGSVYVALSYVWGPQSNSADTLAKPSKTIEDAISVTRALGIRYLWIDRYCIENQGTKAASEQIKRMDEIYRNAFLTIVALGNGPHIGLPGTNGQFRKSQPSFEVFGNEFVFTLEDPPFAIGESKWATRAWTYQEEVLSKRIIYFCDDQMHFSCLKMDRCEVYPVSNAWYSHQNRRYSRTNTMNLQALWSHHISEYSERQLTKQSDALNAILGVFHAYESASSPIFHYWGIPFAMPNRNITCSRGFVLGLQWQNALRATRRIGFPSWSWVGWGGGIQHRDVIDHCYYDVGGAWIEGIDGITRSLDEIGAVNGFVFSPSKSTNFIHLHAWVAPLVASYNGHMHFVRLKTTDGSHVLVNPSQVILTDGFDLAKYLHYFVVALFNPESAVNEPGLDMLIIDDQGFEGQLGEKSLTSDASQRLGCLNIFSSDIAEMDEIDDTTKEMVLVTEDLLAMCWEKRYFRLH
jgi:hypothetical protein